MRRFFQAILVFVLSLFPAFTHAQDKLNVQQITQALTPVSVDMEGPEDQNMYIFKTSEGETLYIGFHGHPIGIEKLMKELDKYVGISVEITYMHVTDQQGNVKANDFVSFRPITAPVVSSELYDTFDARPIGNMVCSSGEPCYQIAPEVLNNKTRAIKYVGVFNKHFLSILDYSKEHGRSVTVTVNVVTFAGEKAGKFTIVNISDE